MKARIISVIFLFLVTVLTSKSYPQQTYTIELIPTDEATINGISPGADMEQEGQMEPRILLKFDLDQIPPGMRIEYAELLLGDIALPGNIKRVGFTVAPVLQNWDGDDVSWDQTGEGADWSEQGGMWDEIDFTYGVAGDGMKRPPFFNVTSFIRDWYDGTSETPNYGFMIKPIQGTENTDQLVDILDVRRLEPVLLIEYARNP